MSTRTHESASSTCHEAVMHKNVTRECRWETAPTAQSPGDGVLPCLETFRAARKQCEEYLECCPDHTRCGERMNTVSMAYKHAKSKANEIVERLLLCMGSLEPHTVLELAGMRVDRVHFRVPGVPFYKPDRATEERIARRLSMMSYATIDQKKDHFVKKFQATRTSCSSRRMRNFVSRQYFRQPYHLLRANSEWLS